MKYLFKKDDTIILNYSKTSCVADTGLFVQNVTEGVLFYRGKPDSVTYRLDEFSPDEMAIAMVDRSISILLRDGWVIKKLVDF